MITMHMIGFHSRHDRRRSGIFGHSPIVAREAAVHAGDVRFIASKRPFWTIQKAFLAIA